MDKLMNASNASDVARVLIEGEYVGYLAKRDMTLDSYKIFFIGGSPTTKQSDWFTIEEFNYYEEIECSTGRETRDEGNLRSMLIGLFDQEEPVYCLVENNKMYIRSLYKMDKVEKKEAMAISIYHELIAEDMSRYKLPPMSSRNEIGSSSWLANKCTNQPEKTNKMYAVLFNNILVDIEWYRTKVYKLSLLDIIEDAVENQGWTSSGLASYICTCKEPK